MKKKMKKVPVTKISQEQLLADARGQMVTVIERAGHDVMVVGTGTTPIEAHPRYADLAAFAKSSTDLYLNSLAMGAKMMGINIGLKVFIKAEDVPSGSLPTKNP